MLPKYFYTLVLCSLWYAGATAQVPPPPVQASSIRFLSAPEEAITARLWLIGQARKEILVSYYIFEDDGFGMLILQKLIQKKKEIPDLEIKILIDASANGLSSNLIHYLGTQEIKIREYHPLPKLWLPSVHWSVKNFFKAVKNLNSRMHDKLLLVDRKYLICGGRNIEDSYYGMEEKNFHDLDILIQSDSLALKTATYFEHLWDSEHVQGICPAIDYPEKNSYEYDIARFEGIKNYILNHPEYQETKGNIDSFRINGYLMDSTELMSSYSEQTKEFNPKILSKQFMQLLETAQSEVLIETPYLLYTDELYGLFLELRSRDVRIVFITNSYCSTDVSAIAGAYDAHKKKLLQIGIELYEYGGKDYLHGKCAVIDQHKGMVGSYNIDPRSANINSEMIIYFEGEEAADELTRIIRRDMDLSDEIVMVNGVMKGGFYQCEKSDFAFFQYFLFSLLSRVKWIYNLL